MNPLWMAIIGIFLSFVSFILQRKYAYQYKYWSERAYSKKDSYSGDSYNLFKYELLEGVCFAVFWASTIITLIYIGYTLIKSGECI
jgi:hypothetical protein